MRVPVPTSDGAGVVFCMRGCLSTDTTADAGRVINVNAMFRS